FGLDVAAQRHFPELAGGDWARQVAEEEKWSVAVDRLFPGQSSEGCTPRVLVFPRIVDAPESRLVEIGRAAALHEVARQSALLTVDPDVTPRHLDVLQRLVRQTVHYRLLSGRDLIEDPR